MVELPTVAEQREFYENQIEELKKINLQNEFTRLRQERRLEIAKEQNDVTTQEVVEADLKKTDKEFKSAELYITVAKEQLAKL